MAVKAGLSTDSRHFVIFALLILRINVSSLCALQQSWLPPPDGPYAVGTTTLYLSDSNRGEPVTRTPDDFRRIIVHIYYPAADSQTGKERKRYLDGYPEPCYKLARKHLRLKTDYFLDTTVNVRTHSIVNAAAADSGGPFPIITVSHGYFSSPVVHTHICGQLASHGYIVAAINHTYESTGAFFPGDTSLIKPTFKFLVKAVFQGPQLPFMLKAKPGPHKQRMTRRVLKHSGAMNNRAKEWEKDIRWAIREIDSLGKEPESRLFGIVDKSRIGTFGHSFGGTAAGYACAVNPQVRCAINMDGFQYGVAPDGAYYGVVMLIESKQMGTVNDMVYQSVHPFYRLYIEGARHTGLTDVSLWPRLSRRQFKRSIGIAGIAEKLDRYVPAFFNCYLKNYPAEPQNGLRELRGEQ